MDSSSSSLCSDWDVVSRTSAITKESIKESPNENSLNRRKNVKGRAADQECPPLGSGVDNLNGAGTSHQNNSNTSSDIDVIEDPFEDAIQMPAPVVNNAKSSLRRGRKLGANSSASSLPTPAPVIVEEGWIMLFQLLKRLLKNSQIKDYLVIASALVIIVSSTLHFLGTTPDEMKIQVEKLKKENDHLKNQAISSKMESDQLFLFLNEQIKSMRSENQKLSMSMQSLTKRIKEQSTVHQIGSCEASPNCFVNFFRCFSHTFLPKWW